MRPEKNAALMIRGAGFEGKGKKPKKTPANPEMASKRTVLVPTGRRLSIESCFFQKKEKKTVISCIQQNLFMIYYPIYVVTGGYFYAAI